MGGPIKEGRRKTCGLKDGFYLLFDGYAVTLPAGAKPVDVDVIAFSGDEVWIEWGTSPLGLAGKVTTRKA